MEYFINVYKTSRNNYYPAPCWETHKMAKRDCEMKVKGHKYIHTIHVTDDQAVVIDLSGE